MDLLSLLRLIARHWRVTVPAALLTFVGLVGALQLSAPTYQATGSIVLLSPPQAPEADTATGQGTPPEAGQNPFARSGDLSVMADILGRVMDGDAKRAELESQGVTAYGVEANRIQRGPVVEVTGKDSTSEGAISSAETVLEDVDAVLVELQQAENADPAYYITSALLDPPSTATAMYGSTIRTAIAVMALGGLGTLGLAVVAEALARRRTLLPTTMPSDDTSDAASPRSDRGDSNGTRKTDWSVLLPALRSAHRRQPEPEPVRQQATPESSIAEPAWKRTFKPEPSKREPSKPDAARQKTAQTSSSEPPADNGHKRPTPDPRP